ncbi:MULTISPECIES: flagellar biosynthesis protein FlhA [Gammaproteobacteria]|uniref:Flagellar biosynthesis protein FlhA n=1 Tax=Xanthomonas boreopolis TaxID=86183 RepID=A0A919F4H8_9XANT|nr:flagellar biosynthesis protein FlhA [Pseudomonas sp. Hp2]GHH46257.1 flagellar biosynthesis protein FlhA [[Pseudomonas] boreopolis]
MSAQASPVNARKLLDMVRHGLGAPLIVLAMLAMVVVPLAAPVLDALFTFNIAISLMVLLAVVYVKRPLDFTIFPIVLLMTTMLRLALNVASTRVILLNGQNGHDAAGKVIAAFGEFVIGGNYAVGIVVFAILTIINFVVITKGAGRVSEVTARFILDAMPGKQMAIDADLNAGLLTREEAKARREEVREEADFYGAMDGASKFIRGDAIAGILILFINLLGGLAVGVLQHGMPFGEAASTYTLLSIGDGLVAQLPALLVSSAVAMLVTRASRAQDMSQAMVGQVFGQHKALAIAAAILGLVGLVPGMPNVAFLTLGLLLGFVAWRLWKRDAGTPSPGTGAAPGKPGDPKLPGAAPAPSPELSWDELRPIDPLGLEVGYRLIPLVDKNQGGELMARIKGVRRKLTQDIGFLIPPVHIRDNLELTATSYRLLIHGVPVATAEVHPDRELALDPGGALGKLDGIKGKDPAFGLDATWIQPGQRAQAEAMGYTVVDPATVIATHLSHLIREHAPELLGHEEVQQLLAQLGKSAPKLVEDLTPKALPLAVVVRVLQNLLVERIPIRQLRKIVEALVEHAPHGQDPAMLTAAVRTSLGRFIVQEIAGMSPELPVFTLAPQLERVLQESAQGGGNVALEPGLAERLHQSLADCVGKQEARNEPAVVLVPGQVRAALARLVRHSVPQLSVLAYSEVPEDKRLKLVGTIS